MLWIPNVNARRSFPQSVTVIEQLFVNLMTTSRLKLKEMKERKTEYSSGEQITAVAASFI